MVCYKCNYLYDPEECIVNYRGEKESTKCSFVKYPNHRMKHHRKKCGNLLMKTIISPSGEKLLFPHKTYCYRPIEKSLQLLLNRTGFENNCEKWRNLQSFPDVLTDVYDGNVWKSFSLKDKWYFSESRNYAVMLNLDWFQPFKHISSYSIGAIYLVVLNLLRGERFKRKNVILVGIIPNMQKEWHFCVLDVISLLVENYADF